MALPSPDPPPLATLQRAGDDLGGDFCQVLTGPGQVAQLAEHAAENRGVGSSILPLATRSAGCARALVQRPRGCGPRPSASARPGRRRPPAGTRRRSRASSASWMSRALWSSSSSSQRHEVAEVAVVELERPTPGRSRHPLVQVHDQVADRSEVGSPQRRDRLLRPADRPAGRGAVAEPPAPAIVLAQLALVVAEQHEPADGHVPWALVAERDRARDRGGGASRGRGAARLPSSFVTNWSQSSIGCVSRKDSMRRARACACGEG